MSRLPLPDMPSRTPKPGHNVFVMQVLESTPVDSEKIKTETRRDPDEDLRPCHHRRNELSLYDGCLMWGTRVVVPPSLRSQVIDELHDTHPGICRMKALARSFVWWPKMDADLVI